MALVTQGVVQVEQSRGDVDASQELHLKRSSQNALGRDDNAETLFSLDTKLAEVNV